jgi:hypothetical protein
MMTKLWRAALVLAAPLFLWGCVLTPGKFMSTLTINADGTFAFAYKGEVVALDPSASMKGIGDSTAAKPGEGDAAKADPPRPDANAQAEADAKNREIAAALAKEAGYRSVVYRGKGKFDIDYAVSGRLSHAFLFPFNADAQAVLPFLMVEVRQGGTVRVRAPGFANSQSSAPGMNGLGGMGGGAGDAAKYLDGVFTLDTDAEIVSQNNEDGAKAVGARKQIAWRATPLTKDAPTAVLRLK